MELLYTEEFRKDAKRLGSASQARLREVIELILEQPESVRAYKPSPHAYRVRFGEYRLLYKMKGNRVTLLRVR